MRSVMFTLQTYLYFDLLFILCVCERERERETKIHPSVQNISKLYMYAQLASATRTNI